MVRPLVLLNTLRYLAPIQIANRLQRSLVSEPVREPQGLVWSDSGRGVLPAHTQSAFSDGQFCFLNQRRRFEGTDRWNPRGASRLWVYHLHYFQWIWTVSPDQASGFIEDWLESNPPGSGPGWEPYPVSLRLREWSEWLLTHPELRGRQRERVKASLALHLVSLADRLEYHLLGNHLLENAISLCWGGLRSQGSVATALRRLGEQLLADCLASQLLGDGSHEERSPAYQATLTEALFRLGEVARQVPEGGEAGALATSAATRMLGTLSLLSHPDGGVSLFNDSVLHAAAPAASIAGRFGRNLSPVTGTWELGEGGFSGWNSGTGTSFLMDAGEPGPSHQPGHAHASALSFELSHLGERVVTDTGVHTYEPGPVRSHDRSTRAHNTLELDGADQGEFWSAFRCGERGRLVSRSSGGSREGFSVAALMEFPAGRTAWYRHRRTVRGAGSVLVFQDDCEAEGDHEATLFLHLAPGHQVSRCPDGSWEVSRRGQPVMRVTGGIWAAGESPYHPDFGVEISRPCLRAELRFRGLLRTKWSLELLPGSGKD